MNEAGFSMGTAISVAGFLLGAYVMTGSVPNIYSLLIGAASIYLGRWGFDNYQTRLVLTAAGTTAGTTYNDYNTWLNNSGQWEATFASWTKWPGLIRNTTMGDATGLVAQQLVRILGWWTCAGIEAVAIQDIRRRCSWRVSCRHSLQRVHNIHAFKHNLRQLLPYLALQPIIRNWPMASCESFFGMGRDQLQGRLSLQFLSYC